MRTTSMYSRGETATIAVVAHIIRASQWVQVTPLPDGLYEVEVKEENKNLLPQRAK